MRRTKPIRFVVPALAAGALAIASLPALGTQASWAQASQDVTSYTPATPVLDTVTGGPWTLSQGDPTALTGAPSTYPAVAVPSSDLLPTYTPPAGITVGDPNGDPPVSPTAPDTAVYPAATAAASTTPAYAPYVSGTAGTPGPLPGYCTGDGAFPETGSLANQPSGSTEPMSPYYFPFVMPTPGSSSSDDLTGFFDYRPKDAEEETVSATSTDGGQSWTYTGRALAENPEGYCPGADSNDNGEGHPYVMSVGGTSRLYMLQRAAGDTPGVNLMVYPVNPSASDPLSGLPASTSVGVNPNTFATSSVSVPASGSGTATIPVDTLGAAGTPEQVFAAKFTDPSASASDVITCTGTNSTPALTGCSAATAETVGDSDDLLQVIGTVSTASTTIPAGPNNASGNPGAGGLASLKFALNSNDSATVGALFNANISGRIYVNGVTVYCASVNGSNTTLSNCTTTQSGGLAVTSGMPITTDPIVPAGAQQTTGLIAPDGIVGAMPQSFNGPLATNLGESIPANATVIIYGEKILNYYYVGTVTSSTTFPASGTASLPMTPAAGSVEPIGTPSSANPVTIYVGVCPTTSSCTNSTGGQIDTLSCSAYAASTSTFSGCTGYTPGDVAESGFDIGGPGAATAPPSVLASIGEGSTNPKTLFKNNEDYTALRYAYTSDGFDFTDLGAISGTSSQASAGGSYSDVSNPSAQAYPAAMNLAIGATDDPELRYVGTRGSIIVNPDGSITMFDSGSWESDGDSDAFNQIFSTTTTDGVHWSQPQVVESTDYTFSARQEQDAALAIGNDVPLNVSAYYAGRTYSPNVIQNPDGTLTLIFSGYGTPKPLPADGAVLGDQDGGAPQWTVEPYDPALYRNIMTVTLQSATSPTLGTTTSLSTSSASPVVGQPVTYTATVAPSNGNTVDIPTGSITFTGNSGTLCTAALNVSTPDTATCTFAYQAPGSDTVTASYQGDENYSGSSSGATGETISQDQTATTLAVDDASPVVGQTVNFTATVTANSPGAGTPSGTVTIAGGNGTLCTAALDQQSPDTATCAAQYPASGSDSVTASYAGDVGDAGSSSAPPTSITIGEAATTTSNSASDDAPVVGETVTYTAAVAASAPGAGTPTGDVTFTGDSGALCTAALNEADPDIATCTTRYTSPGSDAVTASYAGDGNFASSSSSAADETIGQAQTTTEISASPSSPVVGQPVTYTATVAPVAPGAGTATGTVTFAGNAGQLCQPAPLSPDQQGADQATCTTTYTSSQSDSVTASYSGDSNFTGSQSPVLTESVSPASTTTSLKVSNPSPVVGQQITFTATVAVTAPGLTKPSGSVTFSGDAGVICDAVTLSGSSPFTATCTTSYPAAVGADSVTATYGGDAADLTSTSSAVGVTIGPAATVTTLATSNASPVTGQTVTFTATVAASSPGSGTPTGTVTFTGSNGTICANVTLSEQSPDTATCQISYPKAGSDSVTATYSGDPNYQGSASSPASETIGKAATTTTLTASVTSSSVGQQVTFTAVVATAAPGSGNATGTVTFTQVSGKTASTLCEGTLSGSAPDEATCTVSYGAIGTNTVTATYDGSSADGSSTSNSVTITVKHATSTSLSAAPASAVTGQGVTFTASVTASGSGAGTPAGKVVFTVLNASGTSLGCSGGDAKSLASGTTTCSVPAADVSSAGSPLSVVAGYEGNSDYQPSQASAQETVRPDATTVTVTSSDNPDPNAAAVTFKAAVTANSPGSGTPAGTVTFSFSGTGLACSGGNTVTLSSSGKASCKIAKGLLTGPVQVTAAYSGSASYRSASGIFAEQAGSGSRPAHQTARQAHRAMKSATHTKGIGSKAPRRSRRARSRHRASVTSVYQNGHR